MPMDRGRYRKLINNFNMEAIRLCRAVTLLSIGLNKGRDLYCSTHNGDARLAHK